MMQEVGCLCASYLPLASITCPRGWWESPELEADLNQRGEPGPLTSHIPNEHKCGT